MQDKIVGQGITFDDLLLLPAKSSVLPSDVSTRTNFTRGIQINIPICSAAMDTVTAHRLAIALAREGGIGIVHRNLTIEGQVAEVVKVKRSANGIIVDPVTLEPGATVRMAKELMAEHNVSGVPILEGEKLVGILTRRDLRFQQDLDQCVSVVMTSENLVTAPIGTTLQAANAILQQNKVEKLLLIDEEYRLRGLVTIKDIDKLVRYPHASRDSRGRLRVGAAVGVDDYERVQGLIEAGVDVLVIDTAHGHTEGVMRTVREVKSRFEIQLVAGNVATREGAADLIEAGVDAVKVGIGPGSICTTRVIAGVGVPQVTAVMAAAEACHDAGVPVIADGGVRQSGDITKAIAAGADSVMIGGLFAGLEESPGETILYKGRTFKTYRGMGSIGAMASLGSRERYRQADVEESRKLVPEGVEGRVPFKGHLSDYVYQLVGGLRSGMGYCGTEDIAALKDRARFIQITQASLQESHPHTISITREAPNYRVE